MENKSEEQLKYLLYCRKSSEAEERQALSIDSQIREMTTFAEQQGLLIIEIKQESHSAKDVGKRPVFNEMLQEVRSGKFQGIITWAPDRLSRNAGDLGAIVDLMDQKLLVNIRTPSQSFTNSPSDKFLLMILCSQAKLENDNKSINVKRGLRAKCEMGIRPGVAPLGYLNEMGEKGRSRILVDPERAPVIKELFELSANHGFSGRDLFRWANDEMGFRTRGNKRLALSSIYRILATPFYYGKFEYPRGSGKWYEGEHEPIITKELFDKVQQHLDKPARHKKRRYEFNFTKLIRCGSCTSFITAEQKIKTLKSGEQKYYIYYKCARGRNRFCHEMPVNEDDLTAQLVNIISNIKLDEKVLSQHLMREYFKYQKFMVDVLGEEVAKRTEDKLNTNAYARYLLQSGSREEKRELLKCLKTNLLLSNKKLSTS